jgi:predicted nucleic acid-binding protein
MAATDVFMDTAGFLALWDAADEHHDRAIRLQAELAGKRRRFLTTDYIADETATLLLMRHSRAAAADFLQAVITSESLQVQWIGPDRFHAAINFFARHENKEWSFTDCVSFTLMRELNIQDGFTSDHHFRQAGFNPLLRERK